MKIGKNIFFLKSTLILLKSSLHQNIRHTWQPQLKFINSLYNLIKGKVSKYYFKRLFDFKNKIFKKGFRKIYFLTTASIGQSLALEKVVKERVFVKSNYIFTNKKIVSSSNIYRIQLYKLI